MARIAVKYWETYSKVFYVEADDFVTAKRIVEENISETPELVEDVEMESSGYENITNGFHISLDDDTWNRQLDFIGEGADND